MFNLLIAGSSTAWEDVECSMPADRFYGYQGDEAEEITLERPETLLRLEQIPALLVYETIASGPNAQVVRHGRVRNISRQGQKLIFQFEPDSERAYFNRRLILKYKERFGLGYFGFDHTSWSVIKGEIPEDLLDHAAATLSRRAPPKKRFAFNRLHLNNFLSYGPTAESIELKPLNVLIGANGSGKSNFLEAFSLLQAAPQNVGRPIASGGGVRNWLYRRQIPHSNLEPARLEAIIDYSIGSLRYALAFDEIGERFTVTDELLEDESQKFPYDNIYYQWRGGYPVINAGGELRRLDYEESVKPDLSILAQKKDNYLYEVLTDVAERFSQIKLYREWTFGPYSRLRSQARADLPNNELETDASNLGLILSNLRRRDYDNYQCFLESLKILYPGIRDVDVHVEGGNVQIFLQESNGPIPASRLSDGTLRYLFMLAILYDPNPPPLICLEEPELGLHPDVLPTLARLLKEASERTQLVVTTHSPILVDALSDTPEYVLVCEQTEEGSKLTRLDAEELKPWLEKYRLGQLWMRGDIGGTRW